MALTHFSLYEAEQKATLKLTNANEIKNRDGVRAYGIYDYEVTHPKLIKPVKIRATIKAHDPKNAELDIMGDHSDYGKLGTAETRRIGRHIANDLDVDTGSGPRTGGARRNLENLKDIMTKVRLREEHDPFDTENLEEFSQHLRDTHGGHIELYRTHDGHINLQTLIVPKELRGQGVASAMINDVKHYANIHRVKIILNAEPLDKSTKKKKLIDFYKSHGFVENKGRNKDYSLGGFGNTMYQNPTTKRRQLTHAAQV